MDGKFVYLGLLFNEQPTVNYKNSIWEEVFFFMKDVNGINKKGEFVEIRNITISIYEKEVSESFIDVVGNISMEHELYKEV
jgi:hypothetical protein